MVIFILVCVIVVLLSCCVVLALKGEIKHKEKYGLDIYLDLFLELVENHKEILQQNDISITARRNRLIDSVIDEFIVQCGFRDIDIHMVSNFSDEEIREYIMNIIVLIPVESRSGNIMQTITKKKENTKNITNVIEEFYDEE